MIAILGAAVQHRILPTLGDNLGLNEFQHADELRKDKNPAPFGYQLLKHRESTRKVRFVKPSAEKCSRVLISIFRRRRIAGTSSD